MQNYHEVLERLQTIEQALLCQKIYLKPVLNLKEASRYMGVSDSFLYKLTSAKAIAHSRPNGKLLFFKREVLDAWMQSNPQRTKNEITQEAMRSIVGKGDQKNG
ncbi:helix-turn-helix domain-containing protein [Pontibacter sp. JH31]|uniref:Helix-turn-helix domain-containing protein n=1 Tax=Pontibacter aquaedesilientis TaxID=2766980 RepID=A0ABR7XKK0_9BACT|nr:helix-turn-helix domain-containing protein [Pontibacter aquaedesilientis]MBD1398822.1 helix-turn-helix domain-containing protein [Pontibacter aquaedesilientis]